MYIYNIIYSIIVYIVYISTYPILSPLYHDKAGLLGFAVHPPLDLSQNPFCPFQNNEGTYHLVI